jgi:hypothetical protein
MRSPFPDAAPRGCSIALGWPVEASAAAMIRSASFRHRPICWWRVLLQGAGRLRDGGPKADSRDYRCCGEPSRRIGTLIVTWAFCGTGL